MHQRELDFICCLHFEVYISWARELLYRKAQMTTMTTPLWSLIIRPSNGMINYRDGLSFQLLAPIHLTYT